MKIVGVSNPKFVGVTVATKSYTNQYIPFNPDASKAADIMTQIMVANPDLVIIGGWGKNFDQLVSFLGKRAHRKFPVMCIWHGTHFHDTFMMDAHFFDQALTAYDNENIDYLGYAHIEMARYYQHLGKRALWVPHSFPIQPQVSRGEKFIIGVFGGTDPWKNTAGQKRVINEFCVHHRDAHMIDSYNLKTGRSGFMDVLKQCSMITHLSYLECYPNVILEAWSYGIPAVMGPASEGVINNPFLKKTPHLKNRMKQFLLSSHLNSNALYGAIEKIYQSWNYYSDTAYDYYGRLHKETQNYLKETLVNLCKSYTLQKTQSLVLPTICTELLSTTAESSPATSAPTKITVPESSGLI